VKFTASSTTGHFTAGAHTDIYQYQTRGGLVVELSGNTLPAFYCPDDQKLIWWDQVYSEENLAMFFSLDLNLDLIASRDEIAEVIASRTKLLYKLFYEGKRYLSSFVRVDCTERAMRALRSREIKFVAHRVTLGSNAWLVPAYVQESTEATAHHHTTHFEDVTLNREHNSGLIGPLRRTSIWSRSLWISLKSWSLCWLRSCSRWLHTFAIRPYTIFGHVTTSLTFSFS
jgi:hypothetical protein